MLKSMFDVVDLVWHVYVPDTVKTIFVAVKTDHYIVSSFLVIFHMQRHIKVPKEVEQEHDSFCLVEAILIYLNGLLPIRLRSK
jgi:hypothetical protein